MKQAEWNDITWGKSSKQLAMLKSIEISQELNVEEKKSESGQSKKVIKGLNPEELTVQYSVAFAVGIDPRGEFDMLKKCAGMQDDFILNGTPLGQDQFELDEVSLSNTIVDDFGRILSGDITMMFNTEKSPSSKGGKGSKKKKGKSEGKGKKGKTSSITLKPEDIAKAKSM